MIREVTFDNINFTEDDLNNAPDNFFEKIEVVEALETSDNKDLLDLLCKKLRKNGVLSLTGIDGVEIARQIFTGLLDIEQASEHIYSKTKYLYSIVSLREFFINKGWRIRFAAVKDSRYNLEVERDVTS